MGDGIGEKQIAAWEQLFIAQAHIVRAVQEEFEERGLVPFTYYDILLQLRYAPKRQLRFREIAGEILLSKSALSRCIDRMALAGLVEKLECPDDPRGLIVALTGAGKDELKKAWPVYRKQIEELFGSHFNARELEFLARRFCTISKRLLARAK